MVKLTGWVDRTPDLDAPPPATPPKRKKHYVEHWDVDGEYTQQGLLAIARSIAGKNAEKLLRAVKEVFI